MQTLVIQPTAATMADPDVLQTDTAVPVMTFIKIYGALYIRSAKIRNRIVDCSEFSVYFIYSLIVHLTTLLVICNIESITTKK